MTTFDTFAVENGSVTAEPVDGSKPITFDAGLTERTEAIAGWESLVADWLDTDDESLSSGSEAELTLPKEHVLSATEQSAAVVVDDRRGATAVLAYLTSEGIVDTNDDSVTVLRPFDEITETHTEVYYNWAAALGVLIERLDLIITRLEAVTTTARDHDFITLADTVSNEPIGKTIERSAIIRDVLKERQEEFRQFGLWSSTEYTAPKLPVENGERFSTLAESSLDSVPTVTALATTADPTVVEIANHTGEQFSELLSSLASAFSPADKMEDENLDNFLEDLDSEEPEETDPISDGDEDTDDTTEDAPESD